MRCMLKSLKPKKCKSVELFDKVPKHIGRMYETRVKDPLVSKSQIEAIADFSKRSISVKQLGLNNSGIDGEAICKNNTKIATEGSTIDLLLSSQDYKYVLVFESNTNIDKAETPEKGAEETELEPKPAKIPKMFLKKDSSSPSSSQFLKDNLVTTGDWHSFKENSLLVYANGTGVMTPKAKIAAFDLDSTIIKTKSGKVFPKDETDWIFNLNSTVDKLRSYFTDNPDFKFVIFTNQAGLRRDQDFPPFKKKIENIVRQISIPVLVFIASKKDEFRKPMTGSWDYFIKKFNEEVEADYNSSFFCGDAAGRYKDHSHADRLFALNLGLKFTTPEEFFQGSKAVNYKEPLFCPKKLMKSLAEIEQANNHIQFPSSTNEMIIIVGYPGSGKSTFVKSVLLPKGYVQVNRDALKTMPKCIQLAESALREGKNVVIDNTNPKKIDREAFIKIAKKLNVACRCFHFLVEHSHALHNNKFRFLVGDLPSPVPDVAFHTYKANFQVPTIDEGYDEVLPVYFVPNFNGDEKRQKLYSMYLLEK